MAATQFSIPSQLLAVVLPKMAVLTAMTEDQAQVLLVQQARDQAHRVVLEGQLDTETLEVAQLLTSVVVAVVLARQVELAVVQVAQVDSIGMKTELQHSMQAVAVVGIMEHHQEQLAVQAVAVQVHLQAVQVRLTQVAAVVLMLLLQAVAVVEL
jgi:hypothetical protein